MEDPGSDLSQLDKLTEESILEAVKKRYREDKIYSSVGEDILLAVNPYKELPIYDKEFNPKLHIKCCSCVLSYGKGSHPSVMKIIIFKCNTGA
uniref:Myosin-XVI n=1 Tax=Magallana gigas TaxID=29159 RepID=K1Q4K6_MAGGI